MSITEQKTIEITKEKRAVTVTVHILDSVVAIKRQTRVTETAGGETLKDVAQDYVARDADFNALVHQQPVGGDGLPIAGIPDMWDQFMRIIDAYLVAADQAAPAPGGPLS